MGIVLLAVTLACAIEIEGIVLSDDPSPEELERTKMSALMTDVAGTWQAESPSSSADGAPVAETAEPTAESDTATVLPQNSTETKTYSVTATNNGCVCSVDGTDVERTFVFNDSGLEVFYSPGVPTEYIKTGENTYTRSYMGYYILDGVEVPEEKKDVITFTDTGYTDAHFSGDLSSPCCVHTFTKK
jgi:hypothetical protein